MGHADAGAPMSRASIATPGNPQFIEFECPTRQISLRNTGVNTLWISFDKEEWFDIACGTSFDDRANVDGFWVLTQTGTTSFVVEALALTHSTRIGSMPQLKQG
jgi:hypothetical protein